MRHWSIGIGCFVSAVCLALGPSDANPAGSTADHKTQEAAPAPGQDRALDFQVIRRQTKEPVAGADLEIRLDGESMRDVTSAQGRCRIVYGSQPPDYLNIRVGLSVPTISRPESIVSMPMPTRCPPRRGPFGGSRLAP